MKRNEFSGRSDHSLTTRRRDAVAKPARRLTEGGIHDQRQADRGKKIRGMPTTAQKPGRTTRDGFPKALFDRHATELSDRVRRIVVAESDPRLQLRQLIELHATTASQTKDYLPSFLNRHALPPDLSMRWRTWNRRYEKDWEGVVAACMDAGYLPTSDALVTTRLILGMTIGAVQWSASFEQAVCAERVADSVIALLRLELPPDVETPVSAV